MVHFLCMTRRGKFIFRPIDEENGAGTRGGAAFVIRFACLHGRNA
jgi:hypothetical protein